MIMKRWSLGCHMLRVAICWWINHSSAPRWSRERIPLSGTPWTYHARVAQARNITFFSCRPRIQQTLANVPTAQACWDKVVQTYRSDGLVHIQETWVNFLCCKYQGNDIADFGIEYRAALDCCMVAGIAIQPTIPVVHFVTILDTHFEHWCANKREQLRWDPDNLPTLDTLINEVTDEALCKRDHPTLQLNAPSPKRQRTTFDLLCLHYGLPHHRVEQCFYKHPQLRHSDW